MYRRYRSSEATHTKRLEKVDGCMHATMKRGMLGVEQNSSSNVEWVETCVHLT